MEKRLYWVHANTMWADGIGRMSPAATGSELVDWTGILGDDYDQDLLSVAWPWMLASDSLVNLVASHFLTGLRVGPLANVAWSRRRPLRTDQQLWLSAETRQYWIVRPDGDGRLETNRGDLGALGMRRTDRLFFWDWNGKDFSAVRGWEGWLVSESGLEVLRARNVSQLTIRPVEPGS